MRASIYKIDFTLALRTLYLHVRLCRWKFLIGKTPQQSFIIWKSNFSSSFLCSSHSNCFGVVGKSISILPIPIHWSNFAIPKHTGRTGFSSKRSRWYCNEILIKCVMCIDFENKLCRWKMLTRKTLQQGFIVRKFESGKSKRFEF